MKRLNHRPDVTVLENWVSALRCSPNGDFYHGVGQVIRPNHLVRQQHPKHGIHREQKAVAEIRFLPRLGAEGSSGRALSTQVSVRGSLRYRLPVSRDSALTMAGEITGTGGSPHPEGFSLLGTM